MVLSELSKQLAGIFTLETPRYVLDKRVVCYTFDFSSDVSFHVDEAKIDLDSGIKENQTFRYAVFAPARCQKFSEAIILLHGLNERHWVKYLPWAYQLAVQTKKPVILFPIAYHINRSPLTWTSPRLMSKLSVLRRAALPALEHSSFANVALSLRIDHCPGLFPLSGVQTYFDLIKLSSGIQAGHFDLFEKDCHIDFFAYSIGALLTETLLISNPLQLFSKSKAFFFCGGSTFDKINGCSRAIMDSAAFARLSSYMCNITVFKNEIKIPEQQRYLLKEGWNAFLAMSGMMPYVYYRENAFSRLKYRIKAIGLKHDYVVPGSSIKETFGNACFDVAVIDFPFKYSHEVPFPVMDQRMNDVVTQSFCTILNEASSFLAQ